MGSSLRITFQALLAPSLFELQFAFKTVLSGGVALWLALRWGLEQPAWAVMTVFIVAQPLSGMVVQKGLARLLGTLIGTVMSVVFMVLFAQMPWLFLMALAFWLGLCTTCSTLLRSAWSYSFTLAGYTVAIIALPSVGQPLGIFDQAVARCTEVSLGIFCACTVSALLWPVRVEHHLGEQAHSLWISSLRTVQAILCGDPQERQKLLETFGWIVAVDSQREHAGFEGLRGRQRARAVGSLSQQLLILLRLSRSVRRQWRELDELEEEQLRPWLDEVCQALKSQTSAALQVARPRVLEASFDPQLSSMQSYCLARCVLLLDTTLSAGNAVVVVQESREPAGYSSTLTPHRDLSLSLVFGARNALAFWVVASFWMATGWPAATEAMVLTCVVCGLFASSDNGAQMGMSFMRGIILAVPTAFFLGQVILPQWSGFPLLAMAMGVPLFIGALGMAKQQMAAAATSFCLHFILLVAPLNRMTFDVAYFFNMTQAIVIGVGAAVLAFRLVMLRNPAWHSRRLLAATLHDLVRLTQHNLRDADVWFGGRMADRLLRLARHYPKLLMEGSSYWDDSLSGLDLGDELLHLRLSLAAAEIPISGQQKTYLRRLQVVFERGPEEQNSDDLQKVSYAMISELQCFPQSLELKLAQGAVQQLQNSWRIWCQQQMAAHGAS